MRHPGWLTGLALPLYPVLVHAAVLTGAPGLRFLALAVLIVNLLGSWLMAGRAAAWLGAAALIGLAAIAARTAGALVFFYAAPVLICIALSWLFGRTLRHGRTPLITTLAHAIRGPLPAPVARYTRGVTIFWCLTMLAMALVNLGLALFAAPELWSLCTNFFNYLIVALLFVGEWCVRRYMIGQYEDMGWRDFVTALWRLDYRNLRQGNLRHG